MLRIMHSRVSPIGLLALLLAATPRSLAQEPETAPVRGLERALWREERAELWLLCVEAGTARVRVFDPWLRERPSSSADQMPAGGVAASPDGGCDLPLWTGRRLRADPQGSLRILPTRWESAPRVHWGPGWTSVELRSARPLASLLWRRAGDAELHVAAFRADRFDGALQRAQFHGCSPGERIEIALPDLLPRFPPRAEPQWRAFVAPAVPPEGARPTSEWPEE